MSENRRIAILRILLASPSYSANNAVIKEMLNAAGYVCSSEDLKEEILFLYINSLIEKEDFIENEITIFTLTGKGEDVARGLSFIKGVKRPTASDNLPDMP